MRKSASRHIAFHDRKAATRPSLGSVLLSTWSLPIPAPILANVSRTTQETPPDTPVRPKLLVTPGDAICAKKAGAWFETSAHELQIGESRSACPIGQARN